MAITINVNLDEILAALKDDLDFTGNADKYIKVNATADGFEFAAVSVGSTWGSITGTLSDQTDLQSALDAKYDASNPSGYITGIAWGAITGTLSSQTDLQSALDLKANLAGAAFTGDVSVTTSGSGDTLQLTNSGSGTTLNILNSGSGDFFAIDTNKLVVSNNGNLAVDTDTLFVDATNDNVGVNISPAANFHVKNNGSSNDTKLRLQSANRSFDMSVLNAPSILELSGLGNFRVNFANNSLMELSNNGLRIGSIGTASARLEVFSKSASQVGAIIQAAAGQTANLQEWKDSAGNVLAGISSTGGMRLTGQYGSWILEAVGTAFTGGIRRTGNNVQFVGFSGIFSQVGRSGGLDLNGFSGGSTGASSNAATTIAKAFNYNSSSLVTDGLTVSPTINQSGTGGYRMIVANPTVNTTGSGLKALLWLGVGGTPRFSVESDGTIRTNGNAGFTGTGSYTNFTIENGIITNAS